jgi:hypothetical protein
MVTQEDCSVPDKLSDRQIVAKVKEYCGIDR